MKVIKTILIILYLIYIISLLGAATYYVDGVSGDNSNVGTNWSEAWQTISHGVSNTFAGDILLIAASTYPEEISLPNSGTPGNYITIKEYTNGVIVDGQNLRQTGFYLTNTQYIIIENIECRNIINASFRMVNCNHISLFSNYSPSWHFRIFNSQNIYMDNNDPGDIRLKNSSRSNFIFNNAAQINLTNQCNIDWISNNNGGVTMNYRCSSNRIRNNTQGAIINVECQSNWIIHNAQVNLENKCNNNWIISNSGNISLRNQCLNNQVWCNNRIAGSYLLLDNNCHYNYIFKNQCAPGLRLQTSCQANTIISNEIYGAGASGLIFNDKNCRYNRIIGNYFHNNTWYNIEIQNENNDHLYIFGNTFDTTGHNMDVFINGSGNNYLSLISNIFQGNTGGFAENTTCNNSAATIKGNFASFKLSQGIIDVVMSSRAYDNKLYNCKLQLRENVSIAYHNQIFDCTNASGTCIESQSINNRIIGNLVYNYTDAGIKLNSSTATVQNNTCIGIKPASTGISIASGNSSRIDRCITCKNAIGINAPSTVTLSNSCVNGGLAGGVSLGMGCFTNNPLFKDETVTNFHVRWNSLCNKPSDRIELSSCIGTYPVSVYPVNDITNAQSIHCITFNSPIIQDGGIPNNAQIIIEYTRDGSPTSFKLDHINGVSTTSFWGGIIPTFTYSGSTADQKITLTKIGGVTAAATGATENLIIYNITNSSAPATNYQIALTVITNNVLMFKEVSNDFRLWSPPLIYFTKTVESNTLTKINSLPIPGSTLKYSIYFDNDGDNWAKELYFIENIPAELSYISNSAACEIDPDCSAAIEYYAGGSWYLTDQGSATTKIRWRILPKLDPHDNDDTVGTCDSPFPDKDSGILSFKTAIK